MTPQTAATSATSTLTAANLAERTIHRRAVEAVIWGMPAVNAELMFQAMTEAKGDFNQVTYWSRTLTSKNQTLTPNPDTIYLNPFYNTKDVSYSMAYFSAKHLGKGQYYLMTAFDKDGQPFAGGSTYRLNVPPNPPVKLYWSATAYDRETHALIRDMKWASRSSHTPGLQMNADGSLDVYFGPNAPDGKETNWVPTNESRGFEVLFRLYGPTKDFFEKKWILPDIEKI